SRASRTATTRNGSRRRPACWSSTSAIAPPPTRPLRRRSDGRPDHAARNPHGGPALFRRGTRRLRAGDPDPLQWRWLTRPIPVAVLVAVLAALWTFGTRLVPHPAPPAQPARGAA